MSTSDRIKRIQPYFQKMEITTGDESNSVIYVVVSFPTNWFIDNRTEEKFSVQTTVNQGVTYFWADIADGEDKVFDAVEYNIEQNKAAQEKIELYNSKMNELRAIFEDEGNSVEDLRSLSFKMNKLKLPQTTAEPEKKEKKKQQEQQ